jgi:hypothetical protein
MGVDQTRKDADSHTAVESVHNAYLAAKSQWLQRQFRTPLGLCQPRPAFTKPLQRQLMADSLRPAPLPRFLASTLGGYGLCYLSKKCGLVIVICPKKRGLTASPQQVVLCSTRW